MYTYITLTIFFISLNNFVKCDRCDSLGRQITEEASFFCYEKENNNLSGCELKTLDYDVFHNSGENEARIEFDYQPNCEFTVELKVIEGISNEDECSNAKIESISHSHYNYQGTDIHDDKLPSCTKKGNITLKYLHTGCYIINLERKCLKCDEESVYKDKRIYRFLSVSSNRVSFTDLLGKDSFHINPSPEFSKITVSVKHPYVEKCPNLYLRIKLDSKPQEEVYIVPVNKSCSVFEQYKVCQIDNLTLKMTCAKKFDTITCELRELEEGSYKIGYEFSHLIQTPDNLDTIWGSNFGEESLAINFSKYAVLEVLDKNYFPITTNWIAIGSILIGLVIISLVAFYIYRKKRPSSNFVQEQFEKSQNEDCLIGPSKILLLYANDDPIVMQTFEVFRNALTAHGFEVFDVYDVNQQQKINIIADKWLTNKLEDDQIKIILIQTYCGLFLSKYGDANKLYKKPTCYDNYFSNALSIIRSSPTKFDDRRLFIVSFGFDHKNYSTYPFPVSRIYGLPQNFKFLIGHLKGDTEFSKYELTNNKCSNEGAEFVNICLNDEPESKNNENDLISKCNKMKNRIDDINYLNNIFLNTVKCCEGKSDSISSDFEVLDYPSKPKIKIWPNLFAYFRRKFKN